MLITFGFLFPVMAISQNADLQAETDTIKEKVITLNDKVAGIEERLTNAENDLYKLTKIKISGYIQAQWENYENSGAYPYNWMSVRRGRVKIQYEPVTGVAFVLQPDFIPSGVTLKDAYAQVNEPWLKTFSLWAGQFNRPNYEVEYSSSQREVPERSRVIRALYPGERAIGAKLEVAPPSIPLRFQFAVFNGNENLVMLNVTGTNINSTNSLNRDIDPYKDLMGRLTYNFKLGNFGGLDLGVHGYYGSLRSGSTELLNSKYELEKTIAVGNALKRNWFGGELQLYMDVLGGLSIKGEYIFGVNSTPGYNGTSTVVSPVATTISNDTLTMTNLTTKTTTIRPDITRNFMGYYVYLVKNIGKKHQFAARWDYYDPYTKIKGADIGVTKYDASTSETKTETFTAGGSPTVIIKNTTKTVVSDTYKSGVSDIAYGTLTLAWNYYFSDNIRFMLAYEMPFNEKVGVNDKGVGNVTSSWTVNDVIKGTNDYSTVFPQNVLTFRIQAKF
jgi:hypothetical protein